MNQNPDRRTQTVSLRLDLLDMQVVDADGRPIGRIDEIEIEVADHDGEQSAQVRSFRTGAAALGPRIGGRLGDLIVRVSTRCAVDRPAPELPVRMITDWKPLIRLDRPLRDLPGVADLERWLGAHLVARIPGGGDARV